jgi:hypothetical protein
MNNRMVLWTAAIVAGGLMVAGCNSKVTGGGSLQGLGGERASFSVNFDSCKGIDKAKGGFLYKDKSSALSVKGTLVGISYPLNGVCAFVDGLPGLPGGPGSPIAPGPTGAAVSYAAVATWESNDPKQPGRGEAVLCIRDGGEGGKADSADFVAIALWRESEPFPGSTPFHVNGGTIQGNMQSHDCPSSPSAD